VEHESHPYQHFADRPIIDRDLVPLYDLSPAAYQRIVNDLVNLVGAVLGYVQQHGGQGLAQAVAGEAGAILKGYDEDVAERVQAIVAHESPTTDPRHIPGQRCRRPVQYKHRRPPAPDREL
jgi:hypothetical protein